MRISRLSGQGHGHGFAALPASCNEADGRTMSSALGDACDRGVLDAVRLVEVMQELGPKISDPGTPPFCAKDRQLFAEKPLGQHFVNAPTFVSPALDAPVV